MKLSSFVRRMSALKNELIFVLPKVTDSKTYLSNMDQIFMILTLISGNKSSLALLSRPLMTFLLGYCAIHPLQLGLGTPRLSPTPR